MNPLRDIIIIFSITIPVLYICSKVRIPIIAGFLLSGIIAGPAVLGLISTPESVAGLAEIGVIMLLFTIGLELPSGELRRMRKAVLAGGGMQVALTALAVFAALMAYGQAGGRALFLGLVLALSSTAIVLSVYHDEASLDSPAGRTLLGILIFQDIVAIPFMLLPGLLAGDQAGAVRSLPLLAARSTGVLLVVYAASRWVVPFVLLRVTRTRSRELFILSVIVICFGIAWFTAAAGLSLSLGAFLAGMVIAGTEYGHAATGNVLPFKDIFTSIFFISLGMLLDVRTLLDHFGIILLIALAVMAVKAIAGTAAVLVLGLPLVYCIMAGTALCQVGEFSFLLLGGGRDAGLVTAEEYQVILAAIILTMIVSPFFIVFSMRLPGLLQRRPFTRLLGGGLYRDRRLEEDTAGSVFDEHIIIVGYGLVGRNVSRTARLAGIPFIILELNPDTVRRERARGEPIYFGDATQESVLRLARVERARVLVSTIPGHAQARLIVAQAKKNNPGLYVIARTRFMEDIDALVRLGAGEVVTDEFESSMEIFTRVLWQYRIPERDIRRFIGEIRAEGYRLLRRKWGPR